MPRITFTKNYRVAAADGAEYKVGQTEEFSEASAEHFISRGVAEPAKTDAKKGQAKGAKTDAKKGDEGEE